MTAETLFDWKAERDAAMAQVAENAGPTFRELAEAYVLVLLESGPMTGEQLTNGCRLKGIVAHDDRAMGPVLMSLSRRKFIESCGLERRTKGHGSLGAHRWKLSTKN